MLEDQHPAPAPRQRPGLAHRDRGMAALDGRRRPVRGGRRAWVASTPSRIRRHRRLRRGAERHDRARGQHARPHARRAHGATPSSPAMASCGSRTRSPRGGGSSCARPASTRNGWPRTSSASSPPDARTLPAPRRRRGLRVHGRGVRLLHGPDGGRRERKRARPSSAGRSSAHPTRCRSAPIGQYWGTTEPNELGDRAHALVPGSGRERSSCRRPTSRTSTRCTPTTPASGSTGPVRPTSPRPTAGIPPAIFGGVGDDQVLGIEAPLWTETVASRPSYLTLPAVRPPTRRFSMIMKSTTTGMIATIETPNT